MWLVHEEINKVYKESSLLRGRNENLANHYNKEESAGPVTVTIPELLSLILSK
jgi:hypothetical protein